MSSSENILNTHQVADLLGTHIETIRRLARKGAIPAFKVGKDWRFQRQALLDWAENGTLIPKAPHALVVDDEPAICKQVQRLLEPEGWQVHAAHNGIDGLTVNQTRSIDLILLDLKMPGMTGLEFLRHLRETHPETAVIIITGYPDSDLMSEVMPYGPLLLLAKPIEKRHLLSSVGVVFRPNSQAGA